MYVKIMSDMPHCKNKNIGKEKLEYCIIKSNTWMMLNQWLLLLHWHLSVPPVPNNDTILCITQYRSEKRKC